MSTVIKNKNIKLMDTENSGNYGGRGPRLVVADSMGGYILMEKIKKAKEKIILNYKSDNLDFISNILTVIFRGNLSIL